MKDYEVTINYKPQVIEVRATGMGEALTYAIQQADPEIRSATTGEWQD